MIEFHPGPGQPLLLGSTHCHLVIFATVMTGSDVNTLSNHPALTRGNNQEKMWSMHLNNNAY